MRHIIRPSLRVWQFHLRGGRHDPPIDPAHPSDRHAPSFRHYDSFVRYSGTGVASLDARSASFRPLQCVSGCGRAYAILCTAGSARRHAARRAPLATATITPTATIIPTAVAVAAENLNLNLNLDLALDPPWAAPGEVVTFTVTATNLLSTPLPGLVLTATLPDGLVYVAGSAVSFGYEPSHKRLTWPAGELAAGATVTGSFQARVQGLALGETITSTVTATSPALAAPVLATAALAVVSPRNNEVWVTPESGGWLRAADDRVLLQIPPGAVAIADAFHLPGGEGGTRSTAGAAVCFPRGRMGCGWAAADAGGCAADADLGGAAAGDPRNRRTVDAVRL